MQEQLPRTAIWPNRKMKPFSPNTKSLNIYTISMYYTWSDSGFTHTFPR